MSRCQVSIWVRSSLLPFMMMAAAVTGGCQKLQLTDEYRAPWFSREAFKDQKLILAPPVAGYGVSEDDIDPKLHRAIKQAIGSDEVISAGRFARVLRETGQEDAFQELVRTFSVGVDWTKPLTDFQPIADDVKQRIDAEYAVIVYIQQVQETPLTTRVERYSKKFSRNIYYDDYKLAVSSKLRVVVLRLSDSAVVMSAFGIGTQTYNDIGESSTPKEITSHVLSSAMFSAPLELIGVDALPDAKDVVTETLRQMMTSLVRQ